MTCKSVVPISRLADVIPILKRALEADELEVIAVPEGCISYGCDACGKVDSGDIIAILKCGVGNARNDKSVMHIGYNDLSIGAGSEACNDVGVDILALLSIPSGLHFIDESFRACCRNDIINVVQSALAGMLGISQARLSGCYDLYDIVDMSGLYYSLLECIAILACAISALKSLSRAGRSNVCLPITKGMADGNILVDLYIATDLANVSGAALLMACRRNIFHLIIMLIAGISYLVCTAVLAVSSILALCRAGGISCLFPLAKLMADLRGVIFSLCMTAGEAGICCISLARAGGIGYDACTHIVIMGYGDRFALVSRAVLAITTLLTLGGAGGCLNGRPLIAEGVLGLERLYLLFSADGADGSLISLLEAGGINGLNDLELML